MNSEHPIVPMDKWGKDHWSTFAYLETRIVDYGGVPNYDHMRCNPRVHRSFINTASRDVGFGNYPTVLRDGSTVDRHDDWSCAEDMVALGLLNCDESGARPRFAMTPTGVNVASELRQHKAAGGRFATFAPSVAQSPESTVPR